jgi:hypothetical protein
LTDLGGNLDLWLAASTPIVMPRRKPSHDQGCHPCCRAQRNAIGAVPSSHLTYEETTIYIYIHLTDATPDAFSSGPTATSALTGGSGHTAGHRGLVFGGARVGAAPGVEMGRVTYYLSTIVRLDTHNTG